MRTAKIISIPAAVGMLFALMTVSANAFSIQKETGDRPAAQGAAAVAFNDDGNQAGGSNDFLLSPAEIDHIKWCAARYKTYDPTNDTRTSASGARIACRSPIR